MKQMFESQESFLAHATIDYCYWRLKQINNIVNKPQSPLDQAIDVACGYDPVNKFSGEIIDLLEIVIDCKKKIGADYSGDEKMLEAAKSAERGMR